MKADTGSDADVASPNVLTTFRIIGRMIAAGERSIRKVAVYAEGPELSMPCGLCRQVLFEFGRDADVIVAGPSGTKTSTLALLLPEPFLFEAPR